MTILRLCALSAALLFPAFAFGQNFPEYAATLSYKTTTAPTIDGVPEMGEWDAAGPWIEVNSETAGPEGREGDEHGGDADSSFRFKTMWEEETAKAYFLFEVTDDIAATEEPREGRLWERDQIEFFVDGTSIQGDEDTDSFVFWNNTQQPETYGKFGVNRENLFEGNSNAMTADFELWQDFDWEDFHEFERANMFPPISVSNTSDTGDEAGYFIEYGISLEEMFLPEADFDEYRTVFPFEGRAEEETLTIIEDVTTIQFTAALSDDDDIDFDDTDQSHALLYYRDEDSVWNDSTTFSTLTFTGEFDGSVVVEPTCPPDGVILGDLDQDGTVAFADFLVLSQNFGTAGDYSQGDVDCDGTVAFADFLTLSSNFGQSAAAEAASVPEPSGAALLLIGLVAIARRRRR